MYQSRNQLLDLQNYTFVSRYAQFLPDQHRRETYKEAVQRTKKQHETYFANLIKENARIQSVLDEAYESYEQQDILGSQRSLQFGGPAVLSHNARQYNCSATYINRPRVFAETLYLLLCGVGVGFSVQKHHVAWLPAFRTTPKTKELEYVIEDSIEGWADALNVIVDCYLDTGKAHYDGVFPTFKYHKIRPKGSKFSHGVGRAPGPDGLRQSLERIVALLDRCLADGRSHLRPIDAYDIIMHASDAVLSGGVRRSATLCMFSPDDEDMMNAKTGDWYITNPQRARSNNSAVLLRGKTSKELFAKLIRRTKEFGEPGFIWVNSLEEVFNPCFAGDTLVLTRNGPRKIKDLVGKSVEIHDGNNWVQINTFTQTAANQKLLEITLQDGTIIKTTYNHKFILDNGNICEAWNLTEGDKLQINSPSTVFGNINEPSAYFLGFMTADGWGNSSGECGLSVYTPKSDCLPRIISSLSEIKHEDSVTAKFEDNYNRYQILGISQRNNGKIHNFAYGGKNNIPDEVWKWNRESQLSYIAGVLDGDGCAIDNTNGFGYQISSISRSWLEDFQILLKLYGVNSKISLSRDSGERNFGESRGGKYSCKAVWRLSIGQTGSKSLSTVCKFERLKSFADRPLVYNIKPKWNTIISIHELDIPEDVYCCYVSTNNQFTLACGILTRQCVEIGMYCYDTTQPEWKETPEYSGFQMCNLTTINGGRCTTKQKFFELVKRAAILGTFQAAYTNFPYLGRTTENIVRREALIGVSITGIMQMPSILLDPDTLSEGAKIVVATNKMVAGLLGINPSPRCCCIKPEGSSSSMIGTSSGCHHWHSKKFLRRVQVNKTEIPGQFYAFNNPQAVTESVWSATNSDNCITFACEAPEGSLVKTPHYAAEMLKHVRTLQKYWVWEGSDDSLSACPSVSHNVSNTINVDPDEWDDVTDIIFQYQDYYAGISLLGNTGDKDYDQAPFAEVKEISDIATEYNIPTESIENYQQVLTRVCELFVDPWKFENHIKGYVKFTSEDDERMSLVGIYQNDPRGLLILKELWLNRQYDILRREFCSVDYTLMYEEDNNTNATEESACAGGACIA